jgi:hypothetical protein
VSRIAPAGGHFEDRLVPEPFQLDMNVGGEEHHFRGSHVLVAERIRRLRTVDLDLISCPISEAVFLSARPPSGYERCPWGRR